MIAIPISTEDFGVKSSNLFGNAPSFALYDAKEKQFTFKDNPGCGNGIKTAQVLQSWEVKEVAYSYLGDGPFNVMIKEGMNVYYIGKEPLGLSEIVEGIQNKSFIKVDTNNAKVYLDPGTASENCECGCSHE